MRDDRSRDSAVPLFHSTGGMRQAARGRKIPAERTSLDDISCPVIAKTDRYYGIVLGCYALFCFIFVLFVFVFNKLSHVVFCVCTPITSSIRPAVSTQHRLVMDRQTDRQTHARRHHIPR